jgi:hypothetical protein
MGVRLDPGKGVAPEDLEALAVTDDRSPLYREVHDGLLATGAAAALRAARGSLDGLAVAIEAHVPGVAELTALLEGSGATVESAPPGTLDVTCDVLCVGSKAGVVDHENVASVKATTVLPLAPLPITARGLATARRAGIVVLPDFVTLAGPLLAAWPGPEADLASVTTAAEERISAVIAESLDHPEGPLLGACELAERFLLAWRDELPFGRPIA